MAAFRRFLLRLIRVFRSGRAEVELNRELSSHLDLLIERNVALGMSPEVAARAAHQALGGVAQVQEAHRAARTLTWLGDAIRDAAYAVRSLRRTPAFAGTAILTLALGTGANTGIFSIVNGFLRPLPVPDPDRIVTLAATHPGDETGFRFRVSFPALVDYRRQADVFSDVFAWETRLGGMTVDDRTARFLHSPVSGNYFSGLGLAPALGRLFSPREGEHAGDEEIVVLGHAYWTSRFGRRTDVIDRLVRINGAPARIVGVAPEGFHGLYAGTEMDGYITLSSRAVRPSDPPDLLFTDRAFASLTMVGRMKPGVTIAQAQAAVEVVAERLAAEHPSTDRGASIRVIPEPYGRPIPVPFVARIVPLARLMLLFLSALVLLIACLNVMNLIFVRATARQRELAVRSALGSSRGRLVRMLLAESLIVAVMGTALGVFVGQSLTALLLRSLHLSIDIPIVLDAGFDWRVFSYTLVVAVAAGLAVGAVPAVRATRADVSGVLHDGGRSGSGGLGGRRIRRVLVVAQIAGSLVLLVVASFFVRSLQQSARVDVGFETANLQTVVMDTAQIGYSREQSEAFYASLEDRVRRLPGVDRAALSVLVPMSYAFWSCPVEPETGVANVHERPSIGYNTVGSKYFETLRLPIVQGRAIDERDREDTTPVVVINRTLAERLWPGATPIGKRLRAFCADKDALFEVIGVAENSKYVVPFEHPLPYMYLALSQLQPQFRALQVRSSLPAGELLATLEPLIQSLGPGMPTFDTRTMDQVIAGGPGFVMFRIAATQATAMGTLGLVLAVVGLYGVVSYGAAQRTREIGIRLALGADPADVRRLVLREGTGMVSAGLVAGLVLSALVTLTLTRFLVIVNLADPVPVFLVTVALAVVTFVACDLPARRAMRVPPMSALRHE